MKKYVLSIRRLPLREAWIYALAGQDTELLTTENLLILYRIKVGYPATCPC